MSAARRKQHLPGASPRHSPVRTIIHVAFVSRVATVALMILANTVLPTHDAGGVHKFRPTSFPVSVGLVGGGGGAGVLSAFTRWDSAWFLSIADSGYPRSSGPNRDGRTGRPDVGGKVDCRGTARAWGGEEYEYDRGVCFRREGGAAEEQEDGNKNGERDGDELLLAGKQRPLCRPDVPLEEQAHAFFPLYPWLVRWAAAVLRALLLPAGLVLERANSLVLAAVFTSNSCFIAAAVLLYRLGVVVTGDSLLAHRGALVFCVTPASVFFSTAYTESLYAALSFAGLLALFSEGRRRSRAARPTLPSGAGVQAATRDRDFRSTGNGGADGGSLWWWGGAVNAWVAAAFLSLATLARSNGIAGAGVLVLEKLRWMAADAGLFDQSTHENRSVAMEASRPVLPPAAAAAAAQSSCDSRGAKTGAAEGPRSGGEGDCVNPAAAASVVTHCSRTTCRGNDGISWLRLAASMLATALQALLVLAPYVLVQAYAYRKFCLAGAEDAEGSDDFLHEQGIEAGTTGEEEPVRLAAEQLHPWCAWTVPSVYAHVQSAYWGVGALRYYQWKQIPNFLLAAPALILTAYGTVRFFSAQLIALPVPGSAARTTRGHDQDEDDVTTSKAMSERDTGVGSNEARLMADARTRHCSAWLTRLAEVFFGAPGLPYPGASPLERTGAAALIAQWAFLAFFAAVCMNVQVATRFLAAACPPLHWWTASLLVRGGGVGGGKGDDSGGPGTDASEGKEAAGVSTVAGGSDSSTARVETSLRCYLGLYFVLGAVLHANFLPWT
ncbi:unnamed protein product [Scytosiphon promiscuus]